MSGVLEAYGIDTVNRQAMFLAQCLHETAGFKYLKEIWGNPPTIWQQRYEGHLGLGNNRIGDGKKFLGRGLIQCTGRKNYQAFADWMNDQSIMDRPEQLQEPGTALLSAIWFWTRNNLNACADEENIVKCTRIVNGSQMLGLEERKKYYERGKEILRV
jgi:putative chitinase